MLVPRIAVTKMKSEIDVRRDRVSEIDDPSEQSLLRPIDESFELPACQEQNFMGNVPLNREVLMGDQLRNFIDFLLQCVGVRLFDQRLRFRHDKSRQHRDRGRQRNLKFGGGGYFFDLLQLGELPV